MTPTHEDKEEVVVSQAEFHQLLRAKMLAAVRLTIMGVLEGELAEQVGAGRYERGPNRRDHVSPPSGEAGSDIGPAACRSASG